MNSPAPIPTSTGSGQAPQEGNSAQKASSPGKAPSKSTEHPPGPPQGGNSGAGEKAPAEPSEKTGSASHKAKTGSGASWKVEYDVLAETLEKRGYEPSIARRHTKWVRKFQAFTSSKPAALLSSEDARAFLAWLPTKRKMSFSKQTQRIPGNTGAIICIKRMCKR